MQVNASPAVELSHIRVVNNGEEVLCDVSARIERGTYAGIVGPNGGGKTTLLKVLLGLVKPNAGTVRILGTDPIAARRSGKIGYVPQRAFHADFSFPATAEELVASGQKKDAQSVRNALQIVDMFHLRHRLIGNLSGGERQKIFIARALASQPEILLLDEPTTGVDEPSQEEFYALLRGLNKSGMTILFVSHDIDAMVHETSVIYCLNRTLAEGCAPEHFTHIHHSHTHHHV